MNIQFSANLSINELLLNSKALEPLPIEDQLRLSEVQELDVGTYSEADVRAEVIDPIIRALGYRKDSFFSLEREKHLKVVDKDLFIDYSMTLMRENFWVIEAKKVKRKSLRFSDAEVRQALIYAAHPDINAALLVLCNGQILHVFDREHSLISPILMLDIKNLLRDFDKLRLLLSPWQAWFFQKRRVLRLLDKIFDHEPNMGRIEEFQDLVETRLGCKRATVLNNYRVHTKNMDGEARKNYLRVLHDADLIDLHFFSRQSNQDLEIIMSTLVERNEKFPFRVLHRIFPDLPRATNDFYWFSALYFLLHLEVRVPEVGWLPSYLSQGGARCETAGAVQRVIALCLSGLKIDSGRRFVQLYAAAARRIAKQFLVMLPQTDELARSRHAFVRHHVDELSFAQFVSSPDAQLGQMLNILEYEQTRRMVAECIDDRGGFNLAKAKQKVLTAWDQERAMLMKDGGNKYRDAREARQIPDMPLSEVVGIAYDNLGHHCLCALERFPKWKAYALENHLLEIQKIGAYGSWQAREWLGMDVDAAHPRPTVQDLADRFFLGDVDILHALATGYGVKL